MPGITLLGLGPGDAQQLTREAWAVIESNAVLWLRTSQHPTVASLPPSLELHSFDDLYENAQRFDALYAEIVRRILDLGRLESGVVYAVPGHPFVGESTCPEISRLARQEGLTVRIVAGVSFLEAAFSALALDPFPQTSLCDALTLADEHAPLFPPDAPALIAQLYSRHVAAQVKSTLGAVYPDEHPARLLHAAGTSGEMVEDLRLYEIDRSQHIGALTSMYLPPLERGSSVEALQNAVARLRAPDGCPWDREQTHRSLRRHLLEEAYEAIAAIDSGHVNSMKEEFGDLLLQIVLNSQIASELGDFSLIDVTKGIHDKIIRRHPHVFGDLHLGGVEGVLANWEKLKEEERDLKGHYGGLLEGVPGALPALSQAQAYQDRAARVGFDWPAIQGVLDKVAEEIEEVHDATDQERLASELGDLFFALVNFSRWKGVDAESALREANQRFLRRFQFIEQHAHGEHRKLSDLSVEEMNALWEDAKDAGA